MAAQKVGCTVSNPEAKIYHEKKTKLYRGRFKVENLTTANVALWNVAPIWPGTDRAKLRASDLQRLMELSYSWSMNGSHFVLWMPSNVLHESHFDPIGMCAPWSPVSTIISGSDPVHIGYVYLRSGCLRAPAPGRYWGSKMILAPRGERGSSSSVAMRFLLDRLPVKDGFIVEPFAHRSAALPIWSRRLGYEYIGYAGSKKRYGHMVKALAQVELPGIQLGLPARTPTAKARENGQE